ncbi:hypothetical protein [Ponticoccus alexandrii]|uniref:DUF3137 domain-containing protein n=1 Tax=Ponticoccus alexandrii TaxID=1943633 RepID=A0ABX7FB83_9RHOB|nr:hypothetical protein [Ponticoccus alexandrii]ETA52321.2 hypothetical protein P279_09360 [Rhodobacteraceae bacterium PD-2]QRF67517.1 hypothetical protein GQA70_15090 [Ponticoccus alexandrii]
MTPAALPGGGATGLTRLIARLGGRHRRGLQFGSLGAPRGNRRALGDEAVQLLREALAADLAALNAARLVQTARTERDLRRAAIGGAVAGLLLGLTMGGVALALGMAIGGAAFCLLLVAGRGQDVAREAAKRAIVQRMAPPLISLAPLPPDQTRQRLSPERLEGLELFAPIHTVTVDECLTGLRDSNAVTVARIGFHLGNRNDRKTVIGGGLCFVIVVVSAPGIARTAGDRTVVVPADAAFGLRKSIEARGGAPSGALRTPGGEYQVFGNAACLGSGLVEGLRAAEAVARADATATREVAPGDGLRPYLSIRPGTLAVLTPLAHFDGAFDPPPVWEPLDVDRLIPVFGSDLMTLDDYVTAAMALAKGLSE